MIVRIGAKFLEPCLTFEKSVAVSNNLCYMSEHGCNGLKRTTLMRHVLFAAFAGAALTFVSPAWAVPTTVTYQSWYAVANGPAPSAATKTYSPTDFDGVAQTITLPQFDTALGTLSAATLTLYTDVLSQGSIKNTGASTATIRSYNVSLDVRLLTPGVVTPGTSSTAFLVEALPTLYSLVTRTNLAPGNSLLYNGDGASATAALNLFTSASLGLFEGAGTVMLPVFTTTKTLSNYSGGNLQLLQTTSARAQATVSYTYTPTPILSVPEPISIALMGSSLLGLGLVRRWRS